MDILDFYWIIGKGTSGKPYQQDGGFGPGNAAVRLKGFIRQTLEQSVFHSSLDCTEAQCPSGTSPNVCAPVSDVDSPWPGRPFFAASARVSTAWGGTSVGES
jgi:hypothetical protein